MTGAFCNALLMRANQLIPYAPPHLPSLVVIWHAKVKMSLIDRCIRVHSLLVSAKEADMPI